MAGVASSGSSVSPDSGDSGVATMTTVTCGGRVGLVVGLVTVTTRKGVAVSSGSTSSS